MSAYNSAKAIDERITFCRRMIATHEGKAERQRDYAKYYKRELAIAEYEARQWVKKEKRNG